MFRGELYEISGSATRGEGGRGTDGKNDRAMSETTAAGCDERALVGRVVKVTQRMEVLLWIFRKNS